MKRFSNVISIVRRDWNRLREIGPLYGVQRAVRLFLPRRWFEINLWIYTDTELAPWRTEPPPEGNIRWAIAEDFDLPVNYGDWAKVRKGFASGDKVVVSVEDSRVRGWMWFATDFVDNHDWLRMVLEKDECFAHESLVDPALRQQGIAKAMALFGYLGLDRQGYRLAWGFIDVLNRASLKTYISPIHANEHVFYARLLGLTYLRIGKFRRLGTWKPARRLELRRAFIVKQLSQ